MNKDFSPKVLRTKSEPKDIAELISIANRLPQELGADHEAVLNPGRYANDQEAVQFFLLRAAAKLPIDLHAFVTQSLELVRDSSGEFSLPLEKGWQKAAGRNLLHYAFEVARPLWGAGEVEQMRQRY